MNTDWWDKANAQKNNGFYVGFHSEWIFPNKVVTENDYDTTLRSVDNIFDFLVFSENLNLQDYLDLPTPKTINTSQ